MTKFAGISVDRVVSFDPDERSGAGVVMSKEAIDVANEIGDGNTEYVVELARRVHS